MKKIETFEEVRINVDGGCAEIHIAECSDKVFNVTLKESVDKKLRIAIPDEHGISYMFFQDVVKIINGLKDGTLIKRAYNRAAGETKQGHKITADHLGRVLRDMI